MAAVRVQRGEGRLAAIVGGLGHIAAADQLWSHRWAILLWPDILQVMGPSMVLKTHMPRSCMLLTVQSPWSRHHFPTVKTARPVSWHALNAYKLTYAKH